MATVFLLLGIPSLCWSTITFSNVNHFPLCTPSSCILHNFDSTGTIHISQAWPLKWSSLFRMLQLFMPWLVRISHTHDHSNHIHDKHGLPNLRQHLLGSLEVGSIFCSGLMGPVYAFNYWKLFLCLRIRLKGRKLRYLKRWIPFSWTELLDLHIPGFTHILFKCMNS